MGYLTRIHLEEVQEVGVDDVKAGANMTIMYVEGVVTPDGTPWEPIPGPDPWDELVVADKAAWSSGNDYSVGQSISGVSATYAGGTDQTIYRSRTQHRASSSDPWINSPWTNHANTPQVIGFTIPAGEENGQVRFQTQARDEGVDPVSQVNSFASVKNITPLEWDPVTATVNDISYDLDVAAPLTVLINDPLPIVVTHNGAIPDATYQWSSRDGSPADPLFGTPTDKNTIITLPAAGTYITTLTMYSEKTASNESLIITFYAVDAF